MVVGAALLLASRLLQAGGETSSLGGMFAAGLLLGLIGWQLRMGRSALVRTHVTPSRRARRRRARWEG